MAPWFLQRQNNARGRGGGTNYWGGGGNMRRRERWGRGGGVYGATWGGDAEGEG